MLPSSDLFCTLGNLELLCRGSLLFCIGLFRSYAIDTSISETVVTLVLCAANGVTMVTFVVIILKMQRKHIQKQNLAKRTKSGVPEVATEDTGVEMRATRRDTSSRNRHGRVAQMQRV